ncbi:MAG: formate dehydrogenase accessory sulfurtransferase FdhD [Euryarchaeota archaeon]|nr:formate dehydrogenase accessory sulfurtransferase FdhD [Euryarchaeota archaeon]
MVKYIGEQHSMHNMRPYIRVRVWRNGREVLDEVARERELRMLVNGMQVALLRLSPGHERELAYGYCLGEGLIKHADEVEEVRLEESELHVRLRHQPGELERYISSDCVSGWRSSIRRHGIKVSSTASFRAEQLAQWMKLMQELSLVWKSTGGVHTAMLASPGGYMLVEDVSRHIAVDKVIGMALLEGTEFSDACLLTSGRVPGDMVVKAARAGIPVVASRTAPLFSGILSAEQTGVTLVGFLRGSRMNIYTHPGRLEL